MAGFTKPELVAELNLGSGFTAFDDVDLIVVEADDFVLVGAVDAVARRVDRHVGNPLAHEAAVLVRSSVR